MMKWIVETRVTSTRFYEVEADDEKAAEEALSGATPIYEYDDNEETISFKVAPPSEEK